MPVRGVTVILTEQGRLRTALEVAAAAAALGGRARLFAQGPAVEALHPPIAADDDWLWVDAGLPALGVLCEEALGLGVEVIACQTGLHLTGTAADTLDPRITSGGLVGVLASVGDDRLIAI